MIPVLTGLTVMLERTPCICTLICDFCVSSNSGKNYDIINVDDWPDEIVSVSDGFEPRRLFWKTYCRMRISDGLFNNWEFIHIVYGF